MTSSYKSLFDLGGRVAVVTGATGVLGRHFCHALAAHGASVAVLDVVADATRALADELSAEHGVRALGVACDIADEAQVAAMIGTVEQSLGPIAALVNNAATKTADVADFFAPLDSFKLDTWNEVMRVNLDGTFVITRAIGLKMVERRSGSIVNIGSHLGSVGPDNRVYEDSQYLGHRIGTPPVYAASKAGLIGLTKYFAAVWGPSNVRINIVSPGGVFSGQNTVFGDKYSARVPLGRMAEVREIVGAVVYFASDASSYTTGQNLLIEGGLTSW
jgi:NAD(P)-dependent dehydrogenase (short-subunit alcohol dehydrogenase family)